MSRRRTGTWFREEDIVTQPLDVPPADPNSTPEGDPDIPSTPRPGEDPAATPAHPHPEEDA